MKNILKKIDDKYWACRNWVRDNLYYYIRYGKFGYRHHMIDTGLPPAPWRSVSTKILYSVMSIVEWYVENDMEIHYISEFEEECERIREEENNEYRSSRLQCWVDQRKIYIEICEIYVWWKSHEGLEEDYSDALHEWAEYCDKFCNEDEPFFLMGKNRMNEEESKIEAILHDRINCIEKKLSSEEQEMLKRAIDLRDYMW